MVYSHYMATPDYVLVEDHTYYPSGIHDPITITKGTFVRPIEFCYVPAHITKDVSRGFFNKENNVYCYWSKGIAIIPKTKIRRI
jgi:hypothetical protein